MGLLIILNKCDGGLLGKECFAVCGCMPCDVLCEGLGLAEGGVDKTNIVRDIDGFGVSG